MAVHMGFLTRVPVTLETSAKVVESHELILKAIKHRDRELAHRLLVEHLDEVLERLLQHKEPGRED
jgi:DNA-binding GntR family transcriptional regulator